ncbi:MAG TPA: hypothetical protein PKA63_07515 [Oligoflexia bacterium]|mgnify:CR=1 FL=1|nr:hypothetical protein [Oligoflexia bacterium]HMP48497.1 hypothetical protein [Oligoflexia bacterium]
MSRSALEILSNKNFQLSVGDDKLPGLLGRLLSVSVDDDIIEKRLREIPSETTIEERRFLYNFFRYLWFGTGDVLEIGPFLGGTTRAIALGMLNNPAFSISKHKFLTYDQFSAYYTGESFASFLLPLFESGALPASLYDELKNETTETREFFEIFKLIHNNQDYYSLISANTGIVPDKIEDRDKDSIFSVPKDSNFECVFVDGCKSWYGTKAFFMEIANNIRNGSYVIFQDYGWYTCFWIPSFVEIFRDHFEQIAMVDSTYTFVLKKSLTPDNVANNFPDSPEHLGSDIIEMIFNSVILKAAYRGDTRQMVFGRLQLAGALAYIGEKRRAKDIYLSLEGDYTSKLYPEIMKSAKISPTYRTECNISFDW